MTLPELTAEQRAALEAVADRPNGHGGSHRRVQLIPASAIRSERVRWLWSDRIPLRGLTVLAGEKGLGKSTMTNALIPAALTRGRLDGELAGKPVDVVVATAEDDWRAVVKPRLMAHGADLDRVHAVNVTDEHGTAMLTLPDDVERFEEAIIELRDTGRQVGLLVIDPIGAFLDVATDSHKDAHVRRALAPLAQLADQLDLAVLVVAHLNKDDSKRLINRVSGSGAFVNAARSVLGFARHPEDPNGEQGTERVIVHATSNWGRYAPSLAARVEGRAIEVDDGSTTEVGYLVLLGETDVGVEELQNRGDDEHGRSDVEEEIADALADGKQWSSDVKRRVAKKLRCSTKLVERRAMDMRQRGELDVEAGGYPRKTMWELTAGTPAVGTLLEAPCVPTDEIAVNTGASAANRGSRDSGDTSRAASSVNGGRPQNAIGDYEDDEEP